MQSLLEKNLKIDRLVKKARKLRGYQAKKNEYEEYAKFLSIKAEHDGCKEFSIYHNLWRIDKKLKFQPK